MEEIKCPMYGSGRAFDILYKGFLEEVLCEVLNGECPYGNEGDKETCMDNVSRRFCKSKGLINNNL